MEPTPGPSAGEEEVLNIDFGRYFDAIRKYAWVIAAIMAVAITASVIYTERQTKIYQATASVKFLPRLPDILNPSAEFMNGGTATGEYYKQQQKILESHTLMRATVSGYGLAAKLLTDKERAGRPEDEIIEAATERLETMVFIKYPDPNRIMYVTVKSPDKKLAAEVANAHVKAYVAYSKGELDTSTEQGALQKEFDTAEKDLRDSDSALYQFQKDNDLLAVSLEDRQSLVSSNISGYTARLNDARAKRIELNARLTRMRKAAAGDVLDSPVLALAQSVALDHLKSNYFEERTKFAEIEKEVGPKSTEYQMQKAKVDDLYASLQAEVGRQVGAVAEEYATALATEVAMAAEVERFKKEALELGPKIVRYNELARKKKSNEDRYNILVARLSNSEMTGRMNKQVDASYVEPLDEAREPTEPVSPKMRVNVLVAGALSLFFGIGLAVLLAFLDRSIKSPEDAQIASGVPVLGIIPVLAESELPRDDDKARDLYVHEHPSSRVAECCRSLRTNIVFSAADRQMKTMVVSSANPREGKTTTVIYLGTTIAQSGQRVLLVDTDMRRPRLHASTGVSRQKGLSNLIVGDETYEDVIKSTDIPNLFVLPCGPLPPNPAELLMTKRFAVVLEELAKRFDRVILDSPPLQAVTDAVVLSKQTDGVVLVVRAGKTLRDDVKRSARLIRSVNGPIVGVILNEFDIEDRHGYYYRYYGYGENAEKGIKTASQPA